MNPSDTELQELLGSPAAAAAFLRQAIGQYDRAPTEDTRAAVFLEYAMAVVEASRALERLNAWRAQLDLEFN